jgi:membrane protein YdbS with pleckstrin-like domain
MIGPDDSGAIEEGGVDGRLRSLDHRAVTLWRLTTVARGTGLAAGALALEYVLDLPIRFGGIAVMVMVLTLAAAVTVPTLRFRAWRFALRESDLYLRRGVLFRTTSIVPHARIQHVDTHHGPIDRWLGLASVVVFTAGTRGAILSIPALAVAEAEEIRDRLAALSGAGDAV